MNVFAWSAIFIVLALFVVTVVLFVAYLKRVVEDCLHHVKEIKKEQALLNKLVKDNIKELSNILKNHL